MEKDAGRFSPSENRPPPAQPSTAISKKGTKPETVRPTISTPAFTKSKSKPLLVGMIIFTLSVAYLAVVVWHVWPGNRGSHIAENESMILVEDGTFMMG